MNQDFIPPDQKREYYPTTASSDKTADPNSRRAGVPGRLPKLDGPVKETIRPTVSGLVPFDKVDCCQGAGKPSKLTRILIARQIKIAMHKILPGCRWKTYSRNEDRFVDLLQTRKNQEPIAKSLFPAFQIPHQTLLLLIGLPALPKRLPYSPRIHKKENLNLLASRRQLLPAGPQDLCNSSQVSVNNNLTPTNWMKMNTKHKLKHKSDR
jgi:hypothetical protein